MEEIHNSNNNDNNNNNNNSHNSITSPITTVASNLKGNGFKLFTQQRAHYADLKRTLDDKKRVTSDTLESLFQKYVQTYSNQSFIERFPAPPSLYCNFHKEDHIQTYFVYCEQCLTTIENYCLCLKCFIDSHEHLDDHNFNIYVSEGGLCDCGNENVMSRDGFCPNHSIEGRADRSKHIDPLENTLESSIRLFVRHLLRYIKDILCVSGMSESKLAKDTDKTATIDAIHHYFVSMTSKASHMLRIVCEEMVGTDLSPLEKISSSVETIEQWVEQAHMLKPLPALPQSSIYPFFFEKNPPVNLLKAIVPEYSYGLFALYQLLLHLASSSRPFRYSLMCYFTMAYYQSHIDRFLKPPNGIINIFSNCFVGDLFLLEIVITSSFNPFFPKSNTNLLHEIIRLNTEFITRMIRRYDEFSETNEIHFTPTDFSHVPKLLEIKSIMNFVVNDDQNTFLELLFKHARVFHRLSYIETPHGQDLFSINHQEKSLCKIIREFLKYQGKGSETLPDRIFNLLCESMSGLTLSIDRLVYDFVHYPIYKMIATFLLVRPDYLPKFVNQVSTESTFVGKPECITALRVIFMFHLRQSNYIGTLKGSNELFQEQQYLISYFMLQVLMLKVGPKVFIDTIFECRPLVLIESNLVASRISNLIISTLQLRPTLSPNEEDIRYHYSQLIGIGYDIMTFQAKFKEFIFENTSKSKIIDVITRDLLDEKKQLKKEWWPLLNRYYPFRVSSSQDKKFKYQLVEGGNMCPPPLPKLTGPLEELMSVLDHPHLMDLVRQLLVENHTGCLVMEGWRNPRPQEYVYVISDCLYLIAVVLKSYQEYRLPKLNDTFRAMLREEITKGLKGINDTNFNNNSVDCLLSIMSKVKIINQSADPAGPSSLSILDVLISRWKTTKDTVNQEFIPLLKHIFTILVEIDGQFKEYLDSMGVTFNSTSEEDEKKLQDQKKSVSDKRKQLMEKMKMQQQHFKSNLFSNSDTTSNEGEKGKENQQDIIMEEASRVEEKVNQVVEDHDEDHQDEDQEEEDDNKCVVCDCKGTEKLLLISNLGNQPYVKLARSIRDREIKRKLPPILYNHYEHFVNTQEKKDDDLLFKYNSTLEQDEYITSCGHFAHLNCIESLHEDYPKGFKCPLCNSESNLLCPFNDFINYTTNVCMAVTQKSGERLINLLGRPLLGIYYLLNTMIQQLRGLEIKSRLYSDNNNHGSYFCIQQSTFDKEYYLLSILFENTMSSHSRSITISDLTTHLINRSDPLIGYAIYKFCHVVDPVIPSTYRDKMIKYLKNNTIQFYASLILDHYLVDVKQWSDEEKDKYELKKDDIRQIRLLIDPSNDENNLKRFESYLLPFFRELYLFDSFYDRLSSGKQVSVASPRHTRINLEDFDSIDFLYRKLSGEDSYIPIPLMSDVKELIMEQIQMPIRSLFFFPVPKYNNPIKFIDFPTKYIQTIKQYVYPDTKYCSSCKNVLNTICMTCGDGLCCLHTCPLNVRKHMTNCSGSLGMFLMSEKPMAYILTPIRSNVTQLYKGPDNIANPTPNTNFVLDTSELKRMFVHYMNYNNSTEKFQLF